MMMTQSLNRILVFIVTILATIGASSAQQPSTTRPPDPAASPQQPATGFKPPPTIIQAHGWGGVAANFRLDSLALANAGYLVIAFDYRGWGQSDGRVVLKAPPEKKDGRRFTAQVEELREYVDPLEQTTDWL